MRNKLILLLLLISAFGHAQEIEIKKIDQKIIIDGQIDEIWAYADSAYNFQQFFPMDTSLAYAQSVAKVLYDDQFIYVLGVMQNPDGDRDYITPSLRRDFFGDANDSFSILIDAFQDNTNAFIFGINPFGVRREGLIANGGSGQGAFSLNWDNKWKGEVRQEDGYWVLRIFSFT